MGPLFTFVMVQGAKAFAATIGPQCLTSPEATIAAEGTIVSVRDETACAEEIKTIAANTVLFAGDPLVTMTGSPEALAMVREKLEAKFGKAPSPRLRFLAETQHCRCLVMTGTLHEEASTMAASLLPRKPEESKEKSTQAAHPALPGEGLDRRDQGLIWQVTPTTTPTAADGPLVN